MLTNKIFNTSALEGIFSYDCVTFVMRLYDTYHTVG